jgi:hypothetical protein
MLKYVMSSDASRCEAPRSVAKVGR